MNNDAVRFEKLWHELRHKPNQEFGEDRKRAGAHGKLRCESCGKEWAWSRQTNNLVA